MAVPWPSQLQQFMNSDGFDYKIGDTTVRSDNDTGPAKIRRRFTVPVDTMSTGIVMTYDQWDVLNEFYNVDLNGGVNRFEWTHPFSGDTVEFRFLEAPTMRPLGGNNFVVSLRLEIMP